MQVGGNHVVIGWLRVIAMLQRRLSALCRLAAKERPAITLTPSSLCPTPEAPSIGGPGHDAAMHHVEGRPKVSLIKKGGGKFENEVVTTTTHLVISKYDLEKGTQKSEAAKTLEGVSFVRHEWWTPNATCFDPLSQPLYRFWAL
jgi:hypothetical protein